MLCDLLLRWGWIARYTFPEAVRNVITVCLHLGRGGIGEHLLRRKSSAGERYWGYPSWDLASSLRCTQANAWRSRRNTGDQDEQAEVHNKCMRSVHLKRGIPIVYIASSSTLLHSGSSKGVPLATVKVE
jgi:hypothetical protein